MKKVIRFFLLICICFLGTSCATSIVVDSAGDQPDIDITDGVCKTANSKCTFRAAIMEANVLDDVSKITFKNVTVINPASPFPNLSASNTHIDGGGVVILDGSLLTDGVPSGLMIQDSSYNIIQGIKIRNFWYGITINSFQGNARYNTVGLLDSDQGDGSKANTIILNMVGVKITGQNASDNSIAGNYIGLKSNGLTQRPNEIGVSISDGAHDNLIGCLSGNGVTEGWNLISGNDDSGIYLSEAHHNHISGNIIGTNISGTAAKQNFDGITLRNGSQNNIIGISTAGTGIQNLISGNERFGIDIFDQDSDHNIIAGNIIGADLSGSGPLGNGWAGIVVQGDFTRIGTNGDGVSDSREMNLISGNGTSGINIGDNSDNVIAGNIVGLDITGSFAIGNSHAGILINGSENLIGTNGDGSHDSAERNVVSGNGYVGIGIAGRFNTIAGNYIGTDITGSVGIGNLEDGIIIENWWDGNLIGTDGDGNADAAESNLISGNGRHGIWLTFEAFENIVAGNIIGADISGTAAIPNCSVVSGDCAGVYLSGNSLRNVVGTNSDGSNDAMEGNLISGNSGSGITLRGYTNFIAGNKIGTDISGTAAIPNRTGIELNADGAGGATNRIGTNGDGTSDFAERNLISGNLSDGIWIRGNENLIAGNYIGTDISGTSNLGNGRYGIVFEDPSTGNEIGGSTEKANLIAFNGRSGIKVFGENTNQNLITFNSIHTNDDLGINLAAQDGLYGVTPNDQGDIDSGPNDLLNFPILSKATSVTGYIAISGEMGNFLPFTSYLIQFFDNDVCDPSGYGEGKTYLGSEQVFSDMYGNALISASFSGFVPAGHSITATSTAYGNTSEFSPCVEVTAGENTFNGEIEENPCDRFHREDMEIVTFDSRPESGAFSLYVKNPEPYPTEGPTGTWEYKAVLGEFPSSLTSILDFDDRIYFDFAIPENYLNTQQTLKVFSNYCFPPFYTINVSILTNGPTSPGAVATPEGCHTGLAERDCIAKGGTYNEGVCSCPRTSP